MNAVAPLDPAAITTFSIAALAVVVLGLFAARWRRGDLGQLHEWGLGGRRFGTVVTWFLLGGDLYTAYTFIAVPALVFGAGALGFFALPYTALANLFVFVAFARLWSVCHRHGYVTAADFVQGRFGHRGLALAVALTGILATMPYIALQLVGMQVAIAALGFPAAGWAAELPIILAFAVLAAFTWKGGLRAPALIAFLKDGMVFVAVAAIIVAVPLHHGGLAHLFAATPAAKLTLPQGAPGNLGAPMAFLTLAVGSALALFLYPHAVTGLLSAERRVVVQRNAALLPAYSLVLGLIALLGLMAAASGIASRPEFAAGFAKYGASYAVPALVLDSFPGWFAGFVFAAIAVGALVPAAIMSIAAANLMSRNVWRPFLARREDPAAETEVAKWTSLAVKFGALAFVLLLPGTYAIQLQLLGGIWILQTLPAVVIGLWTRWFDPRGLLLGWAAGMACGTTMAWSLGFASSVFPVTILGTTVPAYAALWALGLNLVVAATVTLLLRLAATLRRGVDDVADDTQPADYLGA